MIKSTMLVLVVSIILSALATTEGIKAKDNKEKQVFQITLLDNVYVYNDVYITKLEVDGKILGIEDFDYQEGWNSNGYGTFWITPTQNTISQITYNDGISSSFVIGVRTGPAQGAIKISYGEKEEIIDCKSPHDGQKTITRSISSNQNYIGYKIIKTIVIFYILYMLFLFAIYGYKYGIIKKNVYYFILPWMSYITYLLIFYPGFMSADSLSQWKQASTLKLSNAHPILSTLFLMLCKKIEDNPAFVSFIQLTMMALIIGWGCSVLEKKFGKNKKILILNIFMSVFPIYGLYSITLWKDIIYSNLLLLITIFLIKNIDNDKWIYCKKNVVYFISLLSLLCLYRHNGIIPVICITFIILFLKKYRKLMFGIGVISAAIVILFNITMTNLLDVEKSWLSGQANIIAGTMGAVISQGGVLDKEDEKVFFDILPEEQWVHSYNSYTLDPLIFNVDMNYEELKSKEVLKLWFKYFMKYPGLMIKHQLRFNSLTLDIMQPKDGYTYVNNFRVLKNDQGILSDSKYPTISAIGDEIINTMQTRQISWFIFRPAIWMYLVLVSILYVSVKTRGKNIIDNIIILTPMFGNILGICISIMAQDVRYLFSSIIISPFLIIYYWCSSIKK